MADESPPDRLVVVRDQRPAERVLETGCIETLKHEPRRRAVTNRRRRRVNDRVDEAARRPNDRNRAVPLGIELRQSTGLEAAGYQRDVGRGLHEMGKPFVEADHHVDRAGISGSHPPQCLLLGLAPRAEDHEVHAARARELRDRIEDERDALLLHESAHERGQRAGVWGGVPQSGGERHAGGILTVVDVGLTEGSRQVRIVRRIPDRRIDAVDDPRERVATRCEQALEPAAARRRLDLLRVGRAHGAHRIGEHDARLQQVELAVKLHLPPGEVAPVDAGQQHVPVPERPLVGHVVNRHHRAGVGHRGIRSVEEPAVGRHETGLPVVAVKNVPRATESAGEFDGGSREEDEPLGVIGVVARATVERGPIEEVVVADEVDVGPLPVAAAPQNPRPPRSRADGNVELDPGRLDRQALAEGLGISGNDERRLAAEPCEGLGEGPGHVGQPAGLGKGHGLAGNLEYTHGSPSGRGAEDGQSPGTATIGHAGAALALSQSLQPHLLFARPLPA